MPKFFISVLVFLFYFLFFTPVFAASPIQDIPDCDSETKVSVSANLNVHETFVDIVSKADIYPGLNLEVGENNPNKGKSVCPGISKKNWLDSVLKIPCQIPVIGDYCPQNLSLGKNTAVFDSKTSLYKNANIYPNLEYPKQSSNETVIQDTNPSEIGDRMISDFADKAGQGRANYYSPDIPDEIYIGDSEIPINLNGPLDPTAALKQGDIIETERTGQATPSFCKWQQATVYPGITLQKMAEANCDNYANAQAQNTGSVQITTQPPTETAPTVSNNQTTLELKDLIAKKDRNGIKNWASALSIAQINNSVSELSASEKDQLAEVVTNVTGKASQAQKDSARKIILEAVKQILSVKDLGFYAEILSYTDINIEGNGLFGTCNNVYLTPDQINQEKEVSFVRDIIMHETFHSFNCVNGGPGSNGQSSHANPLDEGTANWITSVGFPGGREPDKIRAGWAEGTYGTKNFYRDIGIEGYPRELELEIPTNPTSKLKDVYTWLSANDPSKLAWNNLSKLNACYNKYYKDLDRNVDFNVWLKLAADKSAQMAQDPTCKPDFEPTILDPQPKPPVNQPESNPHIINGYIIFDPEDINAGFNNPQTLQNTKNMLEISQKFYQDQTGKTFKLGTVTPVLASENIDYLGWNTAKVRENLTKIVFGNDSLPENQISLFFVNSDLTLKGNSVDGFAGGLFKGKQVALPPGGSGNQTDQGYAVIGRKTFNLIPECGTASFECYYYVIVHELGHAFGLPHVDDPENVMYPIVGKVFNQSQKDFLKESLFLNN